MIALKFALAYAARGLHVVPVHSLDRGLCSCGRAACAAPARHPIQDLAARGVKNATDDPKVIREWCATWPSMNLALAAGVGLGRPWLTIDVDPRNGGDAQLSDLIATHGPLPSTITARSGRGGTHLIFGLATEVKRRGKLAPGIDVLARGRYFLVAPSRTAGPYTWTSPRGTPIALAPHWLDELTRAAEYAPAVAPAEVTPSSDMADRARRYLVHCAPAISGSGGHAATFSVAVRLVRGFALDESTALALLREWNAKCKPPWSEHDLIRKIRQAAEAGRMPDGALRDAPRRSP